MILQHKKVDIGEEIGVPKNRILKAEPLYYTKNTESADMGERAGMGIWYYEADNK